ncbi:hypothetical protein [Chitinophaga sp. MM2321]|uniref:hypothetical protein n=1 Tax=Chitinophaga sp. MM2321 TaxID=3137178 RepID=UPI0032D57F8A
MKTKARILILGLLFTSFAAVAQSEEDDTPVYVVDSVVATQAAMGQISPDQIALITIAKGQKAVLKYGSQAANGVVYVETKPFARRRIGRLLSAASPAYDSLLHKYGNDSSFYYIVNDKPITPTDETRLMTLDKKTFQTISILSARQLEEKYQVKDKNAGIIISSTED